MMRLLCRWLGHRLDPDPGDIVLYCTRCHAERLDWLAAFVADHAADVRRAALTEVERRLLAQMKARQWDVEWVGLSEALGILRGAGEQP